VKGYCNKRSEEKAEQEAEEEKEEEGCIFSLSSHGFLFFIFAILILKKKRSIFC